MQNPKIPASEIDDAIRWIDDSRVLTLRVAGERQRQCVDREVSPRKIIFQAAGLYTWQRAYMGIRLTASCRQVDRGRADLECQTRLPSTPLART